MGLSIRPEDDFYETPEIATIGLIENVKFTGSVWEPACGYGAISKLLKDYGHEVYSSDLYYRGYGSGWQLDFLKQHVHPRYCQNIITNPPFNLAREFVERALQLADHKVAMLLRLAFLEGQKRKEFLENSPLEYVYVFSKRLPPMYPAKYEGPQGKSGNIAYAWFIWNKYHRGSPQIKWI